MNLVREVEIFAEKIDVAMNCLKTAALRGTRRLKKSYHQTLIVGSNRAWIVVIVTLCLQYLLTLLTYLLNNSLPK